MTPLWTNSGEPLGPIKFKRIVEEEYLISKETHTSILEVDQMTPREREIILEFIKRDQEQIKKQYENAAKKRRGT